MMKVVIKGSRYFDSPIVLILSKKDNVDLYEKKNKWIK